MPHFQETQENFNEIMSNDKSNDEDAPGPGNIKTSNNYQNCIIMILGLVNAYMVQGIKYILPKTLFQVHGQKGQESMKIVNFELQMASIASGVTCFLTGFLLESSYFQRLKLLKMVAFFSSIVSYLAFYMFGIIDVLACVLKASLTMQDHVIEIYSAESFETKRRILYLSICNILQSVSNFVSPYLNDVITNYWYRLNYLIFGIVCTVALFISLFLQKEKFKSIIN